MIILLITLTACNIIATAAVWYSIFHGFVLFRRMLKELQTSIESDESAKARQEIHTRLEVLENLCLPAQSEPFLKLAHERAEAGQLRNAKDLYLQALERSPNDFETTYGLATVLEKMGNIKGAITRLEKAVSMRPRHLAALSDLAAAQLKAEDFSAAIRTYDRILALDQTISAPFLNKAEALARQGKLMESLQVLNQALEKWPHDLDLRVEKSRVLTDLEEYSLAIKCLNEVLGENPCHALARYNKACCLAKIGDQRLTREELLRALELDPGLQDIAAKDPDLREIWGSGLWVERAVVTPDGQKEIRIEVAMQKPDDDLPVGTAQILGTTPAR